MIYKQTIEDIQFGKKKWSMYINNYGNRWTILIFSFLFLFLSIIRVFIMQEEDGYFGIIIFTVALFVHYYRAFHIMQCTNETSTFLINIEKNCIEVNGKVHSITKYIDFLEDNYIFLFFGRKFIIIDTRQISETEKVLFENIMH